MLRSPLQRPGRSATCSGVACRDRLPQLFAFQLEGGERAPEPSFAFVGQAEVRNSGVVLRLRAFDQAGFFGPLHQLGDAALRELEPLAQLTDGCPFAAHRAHP